MALLFIYPLALLLTFAGAFSVGFFSFKRILQEEVTLARMLGFSFTFCLSFILIGWALFAILDSQFSFGR
jgi:predicted PurR-regulated permease PerM